MKLHLRDIRRARGLTIDQFATMTGLSKGFISQIETGQRQAGSATLQRIAEALDIRLTDLIAESGSDESGELLALIARLSPAEQDIVQTIARGLLAQRAAKGK